MSAQVSHEGRVYIVTGGSRGIGRGAADAVVATGGRVVIVSRDPAHVEAAVQALGSESAVGLVGDLADPHLPGRAIAAAREAFGRLDGAILSSGGPKRGTFFELTDEDWRTAFDVEFLGVVRMIRELVPALAPGSAIALIMSTSVIRPIGGLSMSTGLRPGLAMLIKDVSNEIGPRGIRLLGIAPGRIDSGRHPGADADAHPEGTPAPGIPLGRHGLPHEVGAVASFVVSPAASFMTGTVVTVDGGAVPVP